MFLWYALQTCSNFEPLVEARLLDRGVESFYPSYLKKAAASRKGSQSQQMLRRPFFPGYVFSRFDVDDLRALHSVPKVVRIVGIGSEPLPIPESEILAVRKVAEVAHQVSARPSEFFTEGQPVLVKRGPLQGIEGRVCYLKNDTRLIISVQMLRQAVSAEVDASWLEILRPSGFGHLQNG